MLTFAVEAHDGELWLCSVAANGDVTRLAKFESREAVASFWSIFRYAKMASHAHGLNGI